MKIFENKKNIFLRKLIFWIPAVFLMISCFLFFLVITFTSSAAINREQTLLLEALESGAVHTYAQKGCYPENLSQLLADYHITYDSEKFIVEYIPNGSNLFPLISVYPR